MTTNLPGLRAAAADGLLKRRHARRNLLHFTTYTFGAYEPEAVHELIASKLNQVASGGIKRLMIFAPPQTGKSELASVRFPAFWLGRHPNLPIILTSYGSSLAEDKSRQVRAVVSSPEYQRIFPGLELRQDTKAVSLWRLSHPNRGGLVAAGAGGPITGHGAGLGIIDDPFKDWEEAQSPSVRDRIWRWYKGTFRTRLWKNAAILLIMTRWHEDDLAGRLLNEQADAWEVLRLPALAETQEERDDNNRRLGLPEGQPDPLHRAPGQALAPNRYPESELAEIRRDVGSIVWAAEYQGSPRAAEGNRFSREYFKLVDIVPAQARRVRYWDLAASKDARAAWTTGLLMAITAEGMVYIEDVVRVRKRPGARNQIIRQTAELDAAKYGNAVKVFIEQEPGSSGKETVEDLILELGEFPVYSDLPTGDKDVRLEPFAAQAEAGNVYIKRAHWNEAFIEELVTIPNSTYRDQADACAGAYNKLRTRQKPAAASRVLNRRNIRTLFE